MIITIATNNEHKLVEIRQILEPLGYKVRSLFEAGVEIKPEENGTTFFENAKIKARAVYALVKAPVIADDSGLEVECLNNAPGVHTAIYGGESLSARERCEFLIKELANAGQTPIERKAKFVCVIHCILDEGVEFAVSGCVEGFIANKLTGENGFGYDPVFMLNEHESMATIETERKNKISHRAKALEKFSKEISERANLKV
ncbi:MAG: RdgB/HAM1 family non-canonical purine NTP pyrophosphatase [Oscillospiraceae bacterium]|nr:RdgB/HAM1 family non-canonical purine NTP pyrophosphatase [Oscillospiraceae bacterium]